MLQKFKNQQIDCFFQDDTSVSEKECLVGVLTKTAKGFRFEQEIKTTKPHTRNPKIFDRKHISVVRRPDNSLKFSFKELKPNADLERFAFEVYSEIRTAIIAMNPDYADKEL